MSPLSCKECQADVHSFLDGWLDDEAENEIRAHIETCETCWDLYRLTASLQTKIADACHSELPDSVRQGVLDLLRNQLRSGRRL